MNFFEKHRLIACLIIYWVSETLYTLTNFKPQMANGAIEMRLILQERHCVVSQLTLVDTRLKKQKKNNLPKTAVC